MTLKYIIRLMRYTPLSRSLRLGPEDRIAIEFANELRKASLEGRLRCIWMHCPNEGKRSSAAGAIARALGLIPGTPDYLFMSSKGSFALECKAPGGKQNENQKDFEQWCEAQRVPYQVFYTAAQGLEYCRAYGVLT